jgi:hypothetical protein
MSTKTISFKVSIPQAIPPVGKRAELGTSDTKFQRVGTLPLHLQEERNLMKRRETLITV